MLSPPDQELAKSLISVLRSDKYKNRNELFLEPFDLSQVPGYLDVVSKPLDLRTVSNNLEAGQYDSMEAFLEDLNLIFQNAIKYHGPKETKWIAKFAKDMMKAVRNEKARLENPQKKPTIKLKLGKQLPKGAGGAAPAAADEGDKKTKLKLKLTATSKNATQANPPKAIKAKPTQPKLKLKLSLNKSKPDGPPSAGGGEDGSTAGGVKKVLKKDKTKEKATKEKTPKEPKEKKKDNKLTVKLTASGAGGIRGKELPKGVVAPPPGPGAATPKSTASGTASSTKASASSTSKTSAASSKSNKSSTKTTTGNKLPLAGNDSKRRTSKVKKAPMNQAFFRQCHKVILGLKRRQTKDLSWFLTAVAKNILQDYRSKIKHPMDIQKIMHKLDQTSYSSLAEFVLDVRRLSANCLRYNTSVKDSIRHSAVNVLNTAEDLMLVFLKGPDYPAYPQLLYCWKLCINVLDTLCNIVNPTDGQPTVLYFLHPVSAYFGGQFPAGYLEIIPNPMDFGTVVSNLLEGRYQTVSEFASDCRLIIQNTKTYYGDKDDGKLFVEQAERLDKVLSQQLDQLARYDKSTKAQTDRQQATVPQTPMLKPPIPLLLAILQEMRALKYTDNATKITEPAMGPFEKPVSLAAYPDYTQHVSDPMDLSTVDKRINSGGYETPEDFEYDMTLTFRNCELYNLKRNSEHFVKMARYAMRHFRRVFYARIRALEDPAAMPAGSGESGEVAEGSTIKTDGSSPGGTASKAKSVPRITLSLAAVTAASRASNKSPRPSSSASQKKAGKPPASNQPLPLHIAISRVKEAFPLRRAIKHLETKEADMAKYLKDLMRHPWLSAARPKFVFHVPVTMLFPELKAAYAAKIRKPMDLTTIECTLLAGGRYISPDDFLQDVALVFANAIKFNKDGRDIGDPASCAYYDASVHLLRYARWLSLEQLSAYVEESEHAEEADPDGLPPMQWKLTTANLKKAREEQAAIVLDEMIERSLEGDRWTWHEAECEKLLKALRHQSDNKYMKFFVHSDYPPNYTAYIAKPMDWEKVQKKLRKRQYEKFREIIDDLRLIFENAKKYNGSFSDPTSQEAYSAANHMMEKLESAIRRLMLAVSDRIERERIDHANAEREEEALERAEAAQIRANWEKEHPGEGSAPPPIREGVQKIRLRKSITRREDADFEIPFFDDENEGQHERSYFEVIKSQKNIFEKQRQEMGKMRSMAATIGGAFHARMLQRTFAKEWVEQERKKRGIGVVEKMEVDEDNEEKKEDTGTSRPSSVLGKLEQEGRKQMKLSIAPAKKKPAKKRPRFSFEDD